MSQHLVSTLPSRGHCHLCGRPILCGLDAGMTYRVDLVPLNLNGELVARLGNRVTYRLNAGFVMYRELADIRAGQEHPVLATHICDPIDPAHIDQARVSSVSRYLVPHDVVDPLVLRSMTTPDLFTPADAPPPF